MDKEISKPNKKMNRYNPKMEIMKINKDKKIREVIWIMVEKLSER